MKENHFPWIPIFLGMGAISLFYFAFLGIAYAGEIVMRVRPWVILLPATFIILLLGFILLRLIAIANKKPVQMQQVVSNEPRISGNLEIVRETRSPAAKNNSVILIYKESKRMVEIFSANRNDTENGITWNNSGDAYASKRFLEEDRTLIRTVSLDSPKASELLQLMELNKMLINPSPTPEEGL